MQDEISNDKVNWQRIVHFPELHPDADSVENQDKIKRNLDERTGFDRRLAELETPIHAPGRSQDRRASEPDELVRRRQFHSLLMRKFRQHQPTLVWPLTVIFSVLAFVALLAVFFPTLLPVPLPNCSAPADRHVNWNNCLKANIDLANKDLTQSQLRSSQLKNANLMNVTLTDSDLAYADLQSSNLSYSQLQNVSFIGANLKAADLSYADLTYADLSYADLSDTNLGGSILDNARFDHAIWQNGQRCAEQSIGRCIFVEP